MTRRRTSAVIVVFALAASCTSGPSGGPSEEPPQNPSAQVVPSQGPEAPAYRLSVDLQSVQAEGVGGAVRPSELTGPAQAIRSTIAELYTIGFVDPSLWQGGEFPSLFRLFAADVRDQASRDVADLTLGPAARQLDAVRPRHTRLRVRFLADAKHHALVAVAHVRFEGTAQVGDERARVTHEGEYVLRRLNGSWRVVSYDVQGHVPEGAELEGKATAAQFVPGVPLSEPMFVLVIGSDARPGQSVTATRADSLHIVAINPRRGRVSIVGIPRDSWVPIPGAGSDKINASLVRGGPELVVDTVERLTGIRIDAYVLTGFDGFEQMVSAVGGIDIRIPFPISDPYAHADFRRGPEHLSGREALAFSRVRHDLPNGDFGRSFNQGRVMIAALATLRAELSKGPEALLPWAVAGAQFLKTDLSLTEMFELLVAAPAFDPGRVRNRVVTGRVGSVGGRSVVFLDGGAYATFRDLARDAILGG